jgi:predicted RNA binding protein YcfA (HicA-like mRNA interferase family)
MWREQIVHFSAIGNQVFFDPHFGTAALSCPACIFVVRYSMSTKVREILKSLKSDGWYEVRQKGSHKQFRHPSKLGLVTISYHKLSDDIAPGTLHSILKQAQIKE